MDELDFGNTIKGFTPGQKVLGRYKLDRILGRGGMGVVWLARDEELDRDIALKFLPEVVALDAEAVADLKRETRRNLDLTHPHIVRIHDFVSDKRTAAIAMEYVKGATLAALKLERPGRVFTVGELRPWVDQFLEALHYAHTKAKVVHRDLKPANLMVTDGGDLKITDFGIATSITDSVSRVSKQAGSSGTPVYMSPQQMMGEKAAVTDDLYAVGATLYELLTSKPPFYSGNVLLQVQNKEAPAMAARRAELGVEAEPVPPEWEQAIAACLAKDPGARPQSAGEVAERLGLGGPQKGAKSAKTETREQKTEDKVESGLRAGSERVPASAGSRSTSKAPLYAGLAAAVLALGGLGWYFGIHAPEQKPLAETGPKAVPTVAAPAKSDPIVADVPDDPADGLSPLIRAAAAGRLGEMKTLITSGAKVNEALQPAIRTYIKHMSGETTTIEKPHILARFGEAAITPIEAALRNNQPAAAELLMAHKADISSENMWMRGLQAAIVSTRPEAIDWVLQKGKPPGGRWPFPIGDLLVQTGNIDGFRRFVGLGLDPKMAESNYYRPDWQRVGLRPKGWTFLHTATESGNAGMIRALLALGLNPRAKNWVPPDDVAEPADYLPYNAADEVRLLFGPLPPIDELNRRGETRLLLAVRANDLTAVRNFLDQGADPLLVCEPHEGGMADPECTPLTTAFRSKPPGLAEALWNAAEQKFDAGSKANLAGYWVAFDVAVLMGGEVTEAYIPKLLKLHRPITWPDRVLESIPLWAETPRLLEVVLKAGFNVRQTTTDGYTMLHWAAKYAKNSSLVEALLRAGADKHAQGKDGKYPVDLLSEEAPKRLFEMLARAPATTKVVPPQAGAKWTIADLNLDLMPIAPGSFQMGSVGDVSGMIPITRVTLTQPFWLGKTEVTQSQWQAVMGSNPSHFKGDDRPVEQITWNRAMEFSRKLTERERAAGRLTEGYAYTLPTEAQWDYACRAGATGNHAVNLNAIAWYSANSGKATHTVGQKLANAWGLHDVHGNVWEWCLDWYGPYPGGSITDPPGASSGTFRVNRGGSWDLPADYCRFDSRYWGESDGMGNFIGFRIALVPVPKTPAAK